MPANRPPPFPDPKHTNPYAPSQTHQPHLRQALGSGGEMATRHFVARWTWRDRSLLLRSVPLERVAVVASALLWLKSLYEHAAIWRQFFLTDRLRDASDVAMTVAGAVYVLHGVLALYCCWLGWQYADRLREVAGGSTSQMQAWAAMHYRTAWFAAAASVLMISADAMYWFVTQILLWSSTGS
jgi:hypothetical protein